MRPLFPKNFTNEVQIIATVVSLDREIDPDIPSIIGASAALAVAGLPFNGPIGAARVGYKDGQFILNPSLTQLESSQLDLVVAGTANAVLMVESEASELSEAVMLDAVLFGHREQQAAIEAIRALAAEAGKPAWPVPAADGDDTLQRSVRSDATVNDVTAAYRIRDKQERQARLAEIRGALVSALVVEGAAWTAEDVKGQFAKLEKKIVRESILAGQPRIDGRDTRTVRPITIRVGVLPRVHGSALFTRGETQAIVAAT